MTQALPPADDAELRRERRRVRVREAMAKAAVELFSQKGYAATSPAEIAHAADYSERTFFRYFERKEDVAFYDHPERLLSIRAELASDKHGSAWKIIRAALVNNARAWEADDPEFTRARIKLFYTEPPLLARYLEITISWEDSVAEFAARNLNGKPDAEVRSRLIATTAIGAFRAAARTWIDAPATSLTEHITHAFDRLESGDITGHRRPKR